MLNEVRSKHRAWWSNNPANNVMTRAWLKAGYRTAGVDMEGRKLVFRKSARAGPPLGSGGEEPTRDEGFDKADADFFLRVSGTLKGTVTVSPGVDPTSPVGERWDADGTAGTS